MGSYVRFRTEGLRKPAQDWTATGPRGDATSRKVAATAPPDPGAWSGPLAGLSFVAGLAGVMSLADSPYPRPGAQSADVRRYVRENPGAARISIVGQLVSAASLARFTASVTKLAARSGRGTRGLRATAIVGGGVAAASLAASAMLSAALTGSPGERDDGAARLNRMMFAAGGPVHGAGFGVLIGTLGLAGLRTGELPRPLAIAGLASSVAGVLSPLYFVWGPAAWFIPAGRFSGLLVNGLAGALLGRREGGCPRSLRRVPKPVSRRGDSHRRMR